jgi:GTP pyrophosphokinase
MVRRFEDILEKVEQYNPAADVDLLRRAYVFSAREHRNQVRRSGEPYLVHPLEVAYILAGLQLDTASVVAGLLHDVVEDTLTTIEAVEGVFGADVAHIVEGVTKISKLKFASPKVAEAENLRKMILAMVDDMRVILVKLADRLHNMRTLEHLEASKRERIARETFEIYAPLANRLGIGKIKTELEDLSFRHMEAETYETLKRAVEARRKVSEEFIEEIRTRLGTALSEQGIQTEITGRLKSTYSIYRKMRAQKIGIDEVYDYVAFRIIVNTVKDCYGALGIVHATRSRSEPRRCIWSPRKASRLTGSTRRAAPFPTTTPRRSPGSGGSSTGSRTWRTLASFSRWSRSTSTPRRSTPSPPRVRCCPFRVAPLRSTSPTGSTPRSAISAPVPRSMAGSSR